MFGFFNKKKGYKELDSLLVVYYSKVLSWDYARVNLPLIQTKYVEVVEQVFPLLKKWAEGRKLKREELKILDLWLVDRQFKKRINEFFNLLTVKEAVSAMADFESGQIISILAEKDKKGINKLYNSINHVLDKLTAQFYKEFGNSPKIEEVTQNLEDYIILPGKIVDRHYKYPSMLVPINLTYDNLSNEEAIKIFLDDATLMLTIRQFIDFYNILKSGIVYNGKGERLTQENIDKILGSMNNSGEYFGNLFYKANRFDVPRRYIKYITIDENGKKEFKTERVYKDFSDVAGGIILSDFNYWLNNATYQGLPSNDFPKKYDSLLAFNTYELIYNKTPPALIRLFPLNKSLLDCNHTKFFRWGGPDVNTYEMKFGLRICKLKLN